MKKEIVITVLNARVLVETELGAFKEDLKACLRDKYAEFEKEVSELTTYAYGQLEGRGYIVFISKTLNASQTANLCASLSARILKDIGLQIEFLIGNVAEELFKEMYSNETINMN